MQIEVGAILEGRVTSITKFGAFVELPENKTGMIHISEISTGFVKEISDHLKEDQIVRVKVIQIDQNGRINLSIKRLLEQEQPQQRPARRPAPRRGNVGWQPKQVVQPVTFEEMMTKFKADSDDKISALRRNVESKRGSGGKRRG
ncbi:MAG: S1 RNA-binding domain-containing protein [Clostridia bacterium]|nr:S1 RNA-binding domain-containing protein [Clostridia bacterium]MBQ6058525.1 S1 RNA-binding domain-containing protein [Clostridia bacterium]